MEGGRADNEDWPGRYGDWLVRSGLYKGSAP